MESGRLESFIEPYSPEWWKLRHGTFTGSEIWKLMTEPKGKSPFEKYSEHVKMLEEWQTKYDNSNKETKTAQKLLAKIEDRKQLTKKLYEHRNDIHISDTAETYILENVHERLTGKAKTGIDNFATQWGVEHEPLAKKWYTKITGLEIEDPSFQLHSLIDNYGCTPDGLTKIKTLEFKCPANGVNHLKHWLISSDEYFKENHANYFYQCHSEMDIFGKLECDFVSFDPRIDNDKGMFFYTMKLDPEVVELMHDKITEANELFNGYLELFK